MSHYFQFRYNFLQFFIFFSLTFIILQGIILPVFIYLRIKGELSFKEIGNIMNQTENWARTTFYRGKIKMKEGDKNTNGRKNCM